MHTLLISVSLSMISLAGGMILLERTNKDNLGLFFRLISYFIIIVSFLALAFTALQGCMSMYGKSNWHKMRYEKMMDHNMGFMKEHMGPHAMGKHGCSDWRGGNSCSMSGGMYENMHCRMCGNMQGCMDGCNRGVEQREKCPKDSCIMKTAPEKEKRK